MGIFTVIPENTFNSMQLDAGVLLYTFDPTNPAPPQDEHIVCATTGGVEAKCEPTYSDLGEDVDNCPTNMKELKHLDGWNCTFGFTSLSNDVKGIQLALGAADIDGNKVTPRRNLKQSDFNDLWWVGDKADGGFVAVKLINALSTDGLTLKTEKSTSGETEVTLTGHVSIQDQNTMPMEFYSYDGEESE